MLSSECVGQRTGLAPTPALERCDTKRSPFDVVLLTEDPGDRGGSPSEDSSPVASSPPASASARSHNYASLTGRMRTKVGTSNAAERHRRLMLDKIANRLYDKANRKIPTLRSVFAHLDEDGVGVVDRNQFKVGLRRVWISHIGC